ncbi:MAG: 23S rRNA (pseudouridine(1915)-N(3))-methyltransferase RlmH [Gammaproteobacteria bacterium]
MKAQLVAVGTQMPRWITEGWQTYTKRLPPHFAFTCQEIPLHKRTKGADIQRFMSQEGEAMAKAIASHHRIVALAIDGSPWDTPTLAQRITQWQQQYRGVSFLVGGPEGLASDCIKIAHEQWSLSPLTLPHPLVRIILAEQWYRAWSIIAHHPYHR